MRKILLYIFSLFFLLSCQDTFETIQPIDVSDAPDLEGQSVAFSVVLPSVKNQTRALNFETEEAMNAELSHYKPVTNHPGYTYNYRIYMYKEGVESSLGNAYYRLATEEIDGDYVNVQDGTLAYRIPSENNTNTNPALLWPDNVNRYGFRVEAGYDNISSNQDGESEFYKNDRLEGYAFAPVVQNGSSDDLEGINFHSSKEWYTLNKTALGEGKTPEKYKTVPVYLRHKHAWVTIVLKAGKGIPRDYLWYSNTEHGFEGKLYYYENSDQKTITSPWRRQWHVDYDKDSNGEEDKNDNNKNTTMIHAIVEPTNYLENPDQLIGQVKLNGLTFTYAPVNDVDYSVYNDNKNKTADELAQLTAEERGKISAAIAKMQYYDVKAGQHLMITATLTTDRVVLITAQLEDWDEMSMTSVCDDYGGQGNPEIIRSRDELKEFLQSAKNKAGTTALIASTELYLDRVAKEAVYFTEDEINKAKEGDTAYGKTTNDIKTPAVTAEAWPSGLDLHCTLNLAGAVLHTQSQMLNNIDENGTLINGSVELIGKRADMEGAICTENKGTIEQIKVLVDEDVRKNVYATKGGLVGTNYGYILNCENNLAVQGATGFIGGIAGESRQDSRTGAPVPIIDNCIVNSRVGTAEMTEASMNAITGAGGIVGYAEGRVSRCDFNYGMTLMQQSNTANKYKNIVHSTTTDSDATGLIVNAYGNSWPTTVSNEIGSGSNENNNPYASFDAVLDCQKELEVLLKTTEHAANGSSRYQIADDFEVDDTWNLGLNEDISLPGKDGNTGSTGSGISGEQQYHLKFELDGNDKTITTNGKMLFTNINGYFHDFTVYCNRSIISETSAASTEGIAPLAFSVNGANAKLSGIKVKMASDTYIQASTPSGLVVLAYGGATIENCEIRTKIKVKYADDFNEADAWKYAGGIVACATDVTISGCKVHTGTTIESDQSTNNTIRKSQYRGGIVGGIVARQGYTPKVVIIDCNSWWGDAVENPGQDFSPAGSIIGSSYYINAANQQTIGLEKGKSSGNWWPEGSPYKYKAASDLNDAMTTDYLGKRNSITPDAVTNF